MQAQEVADSVRVTPGNLKELLGDRKDLITDLTLTGSINGEDIATIRSMERLTAINLADADIVEGGSYTVTDRHGASHVVKVTGNRIPAAMFYQLGNLTYVVIPESITSIEDGAFQESGITSIEIDNNVRSIGNNVFQGCKELTSAVIGNSVTYMGDAVFESCENLFFVLLSYGITDLRYSTFSGCYGLTNIEIPNTVTSIDSYAFMNCTGLSSVVIPDRVRFVGDNAFGGCLNLYEIHCSSPTPPMTTFSSFNGIFFNMCRLYVPRGSARAYRKAPGWNNFTRIIEEVPFSSVSAGIPFGADIYGQFVGSDSSNDSLYLGIQVVQKTS